MMELTLTREPRYDSRGLPEGYDPLKFYEYRIDILKARAQGLESYVYLLMPESLIKSIAIAIDPFSGFKVSSGVITPVNRTRYRSTASVLDRRKQHYYRFNESGSTTVNYDNIPGNVGPFEVHPPVVLNDQLYDYPSQQPLKQYTKDTTRRTRLMGSEQGEFEKFKAHIYSTPRKTVEGEIRYGLFTLNDNLHESHLSTVTRSREMLVRSMIGSSALLSPDVYNALIASEKSAASGLMQKHALGMFKGILPENRSYTSFRNLVELRDLPRSIRGLRDTVRNLLSLERSLKIPSRYVDKVRTLKTNLKDIPKEYLSYHFGWKQVVKDIHDAMNAPAKISKQINFMLSRNGKASTYRSTRKFLTGNSGVSGFEYVYMGGEYNLSSSSRIERETELRMVVNATYRFPDVNVPEFIGHLYADKLGIYPRLIDVYNLTPWTWLVDWFTGVGNYLEIIENINNQRSLINWGMMTAVTRGRLVTDYHSKSDIYDYKAIDLPNPYSPGQVSILTHDNRHTSYLEFELQLRSDIANIMSVNKTTDPSTLTGYQLSILGALLAQRTDLGYSRNPSR